MMWMTDGRNGSEKKEVKSEIDNENEKAYASVAFENMESRLLLVLYKPQNRRR